MTTADETPAEKADRLAATVSSLLDGPVGMAGCGCPNNVLGAPPVLHICRACGFEGGWDNVHVRCAGCPKPPPDTSWIRMTETPRGY